MALASLSIAVSYGTIKCIVAYGETSETRWRRPWFSTNATSLVYPDLLCFAEANIKFAEMRSANLVFSSTFSLGGEEGMERRKKKFQYLLGEPRSKGRSAVVRKIPLQWKNVL